jgi:hypothetical protein
MHARVSGLGINTSRRAVVPPGEFANVRRNAVLSTIGGGGRKGANRGDTTRHSRFRPTPGIRVRIIHETPLAPGVGRSRRSASARFGSRVRPRPPRTSSPSRPTDSRRVWPQASAANTPAPRVPRLPFLRASDIRAKSRIPADASWIFRARGVPSPVESFRGDALRSVPSGRRDMGATSARCLPHCACSRRGSLAVTAKLSGGRRFPKTSKRPPEFHIIEYSG